MANKLKDMELTSVDLCKRGANPMADIKLFKSADSQEKGGRSMNQNENGLFQRFLSRVEKAVQEAQNTTITKADSAADLHTMTQAVEKSIQSIIADDSLSAVEKSEMMAESLQHFTMDATEGIQKWSRATGVFKDEDDGPDDDDEFDEDEDFDDEEPDEEDGGDDDEDEDYYNDEDDEDEDGGEDRPAVRKGADFNMAIDIAKMSAEDQATLAALEKKYAGTDADTGSGGAEMHPEVKKALDEVAELKKAMEMNELTAVAKKYEAIGKKADELAGKLYELKKAGEQHYNDYVALLDEQLQITNASGIFKEYGSNRASGASDLGGIVAEIQKADPKITYAEAVVKAYETNPNLDQYSGKRK